MRAPDFWARDGVLPRLLEPAAAIWRCAGALERRWARPQMVPGLAVVCVGNLVVGGAGKTPLVLALGALLQQRGIEAAALARGHGGSAAGPLQVDPKEHSAGTVGDEALLLARALPTWVARERVAGARAAQKAGARILLLDDGFQDPALAKDLSLLAVDGGFGFGNGRVVPAGPLREPLAQGLARAQGAVLIGEDRAGVASRLSGRLPLLRARLEPPPAAAAAFAEKRVFAFAGIGRPGKFFESLRELGVELAGTRAFPDHHPYGEAELAALAAEAETLGALAVTTEKDLVRIPAARRGAFGVLPVSLVVDEPQALDALLAPLLAVFQEAGRD